MRPVFIALALFSLVSFVQPGRARASATVDTLAFMEQRVGLSAAGDAALTVTLLLAAGGPGRVLLPFGFAKADSFFVEGGDATFAPDAVGNPVALQVFARRKLMALDFGAGARAGDTVRVRCRLPGYVDWAAIRGEFGAHPLAKTFIDDSDVSLGEYRLVMQLPTGFQVRRIATTEPAYKPQDSPVPPFTVGREGGVDYAAMRVKHLRPGGRVQLGFEAERRGRGVAPLAWGLGIGLLYLWFFRDSVGLGRSASAPAQRPAGSRP